MKTTVKIFAWSLLSTWALTEASALAQPDCDLPPAGYACNSPQIACTTHDDSYVAAWCGSGAEVALMSDGLGMEDGQWSDGWGAEEPCNVDLPYARLLGAAYLIRVVENSASRFGLLRTVVDDESGRLSLGQYWGFAGDYSDDEWEPSCDDEVVARHTCDVDCYVNMHIEGMYRRAVGPRGSTLVHETVHEDVGHIDEDDCTPSTTSCDEAYGEYNANTGQINYLHDAMLTYRLVQGDAGIGRLVARSGAHCKYVDYFPTNEQSEMDTLADGCADRFSSPVSYGDLQAQVTARKAYNSWTCDTCDPDRWVFDPQSCGQQEACNEIMNSGNVGRNASARAACTAYNTAIAEHVANGTLTPELTGTLYEQMLAQTAYYTNTCMRPAEAEARTFCEDEKAQAAVATDIDGCGWLDDVVGADISKVTCVKEWCYQELADALAAGQVGADEWIANDPSGCLDYLCGDQTCDDFRDREECLFAFQLGADLEDPSYSCGLSGCNSRLEACVYPFYAAGQWDFGMPYPGNCELQFQVCELMSRLAGLAFMNLESMYNPIDIWQDRFDQVFSRSRNPGRDFYRFTQSTRDAVAATRIPAEQTRLALQYTQTPEMVVQMFHAAPGKFVWMFGREGFQDVLGPEVETVPMEPVDFADLAPEGQAPFRLFLSELDGLTPGAILPGSMGNFAVR